MLTSGEFTFAGMSYFARGWQPWGVYWRRVVTIYLDSIAPGVAWGKRVSAYGEICVFKNDDSVILVHLILQLKSVIPYFKNVKYNLEVGLVMKIW